MKVLKNIKRLIPEIRLWEGKKTSEIVRKPAKFGLGQLPKKRQPDSISSMVCGYCSTGCSLNVHLKDKEAISLTPNYNYPVNLGMACPKGWEALTPLKSADRAITPLIRYSKEDKLNECNWDSALTYFCDKIKSIQKKYGKESVAFISTGQICTEEMAFLGSLAKFGMGVLHGDGNTRQCMATAVTAYKQSFGFDSPPYTYEDFEKSDVIILVGANLCIAHPIMWQRVLANKNNPKIIVIDPRKTETANASTHHYAISPKSDLYLFYGIANILISKNWIDENFINKYTNSFKDFSTHVKKFTLDLVSEKTGISKVELLNLANIIYKGKNVSFWWTMGVNQGYEATRTAQSIINISLMTGNIGRPGTGANSITGQCNAMGSRLFSNTTNLLGGHDFINPKHREKVSKILNIPQENIPKENSLPYHKIIENIDKGKIKALWVIATNPMHSWINRGELDKVLFKLDFLVVQDMFFSTDTAIHADLVLPAAGWGEKDGTFINSERRIGVIKNNSKSPGQALSDFRIFKLISQYWGCSDLFKEWNSPFEVFELLKKLSKGQPCDFSNIKDYEHISKKGGIQWPFFDDNLHSSQQRRLFEDKIFYHKDKKAIFLFSDPTKNPEKISNDFPFCLLTGRGSSSQWHTQTRTSKSKILRKLYPKEIYVEINIQDAKKLGINSNDKVLVKSRRGEIIANCFLSSVVKPSQVFLPMHYKETNLISHPSFDPYSSQPNYKYCAVSLEKYKYN